MSFSVHTTAHREFFFPILWHNHHDHSPTLWKDMTVLDIAIHSITKQQYQLLEMRLRGHCLNGPRHTKRPLMSWVGVIPKEGWTHVEATFKKKNATWCWQWALPVNAITPCPFADMNFRLLAIILSEIWSVTDGQKAMHMRPPCNRHRWAKKSIKKFK